MRSGAGGGGARAEMAASWGDSRARSDRDRDRGGDRWADRRRDDRHHEDGRPEQHVHSLEGALGSARTEPIKTVQIDALVFLQIMKHCRQQTPNNVTGMLLGLDVDDVLQVTHSFGYVNHGSTEDGAGHAEDGRQYQVEMLKRLREVNVDSNTVGWYQTTHLGQFFSHTVIDTQYQYQTEIGRAVLVVYDSLQSAIGKPAFKALQLTPEFMKTYAESSDAGRAAMADFPSNDMFLEIPVSITSSGIMEAFLVDWAIQDPVSTTSQVGILDVENQAFLEKNVHLLITALQDLAEEQNKLIMFERQAARKGEPPAKGRGGYRQNQMQPRQLDTMILSQQIQNYCRAINGFASDSFGKVYLMSNKPSGSGGKVGG